MGMASLVQEVLTGTGTVTGMCVLNQQRLKPERSCPRTQRLSAHTPAHNVLTLGKLLELEISKSFLCCQSIYCFWDNGQRDRN